MVKRLSRTLLGRDVSSKDLWRSLSVVLVLCLGVMGVSHSLRKTYVTLATQLTLEQSVRLTRILKRENIRYQFDAGGRKILVSSSDKTRLAERKDLQKFFHIVHDSLPWRLSPGVVEASNARSLKSITQIAQKQMKPHAPWRVDIERSLQREFGSGVTQVEVYQVGKYDPWGLRPQGSPGELWRSHVVVTALVDKRWLERQTHRQLLEIKSEPWMQRNTTGLVETEQGLAQLEVDRRVRKILQNVFESAKDPVTYQVLVGFTSFDLPPSEAQFSTLKGIFPLWGVGVVLFLLSFLLFRAGVTFVRAGLSSL